MPILRTRFPKLCRRKSNDTAYVTVAGKKIYLGKWGTPEAEIKYRTLELYPEMTVDDFGPLELEAVRDSFQAQGFERGGEHREYSRQYQELTKPFP